MPPYRYDTQQIVNCGMIQLSRSICIRAVKESESMHVRLRGDLQVVGLCSGGGWRDPSRRISGVQRPGYAAPLIVKPLMLLRALLGGN